MREIKFRAWDRERQRMLHFGEPCLNTNSPTTYLCFPMIDESGKEVYDPDSMWDSPDDRMVMLEYTGLKDKNGKEIYEGDIVQFTAFKVIMRQEVSWGAIFHETQMGDTHSGAGFEIMDLSDPSTCEVIGNRYQNPELIPA